MLTKLLLENFKRHRSLAVDFTDGLNLVTGPNYVGKSTVLQAVRYALEGATAIPGGKAVSTLHGEKNHKVELSMRVNDNDYVITRTLTKATLTRDGKVIAKSASAVTNHLAELLGMSGQRFGQLRYGKQKETEALLTLGATELHKIVGEVSRVEVINEVIAKCGTAASECNGALEVIPDVDLWEVQAQIDTLKGEAATVHAELTELVSRIDEKNTILASMKTSLAEVTQQVQAVKAANAERRRLDDDWDELDGAITAAKQHAESLAGAQEKFEYLRDTLEKVTQGISEVSVQASQLAAKEKEHALLEGRLEATMAEAEKFAEVLAEHAGMFDTAPLHHQVQEAFKERAAAESKIIELQQSIASGMCPTCKRPYEEGLNVGPIEEQIRELTTELPTLNRAYHRAQQELDACLTSNESLKKTNERLESAQATAYSQKTKLAALSQELMGLSEHDPAEALSELKAKANALRTELTQATEDATALAVAMSEWDAFQTRLSQVKAKREELGPTEAEASTDQFSSEVTDLENEIAELTSVYTPKSHEYTRITGALGTLGKEKADGLAQCEKRTELSMRLGTAKQLQKYLRSNRDRFMEKVWGGIMGQASTFAAACTGGAIEQVSRDEGGKFTFIEAGHELPVAAASGAQRSIMGLGVQLAMASLLPCPLPTILLDEPGSDMDPERSLSLTTLLAADHNQLIMVSHRELDGAIANNTIALERE